MVYDYVAKKMPNIQIQIIRTASPGCARLGAW